MSRLLFLQRSMRVLFLSLVLFELTDAHNFLLVSPVFGYSHLKFMSKVGDTLANAGHNVVSVLSRHGDFYVMVYSRQSFKSTTMNISVKFG